MSTNLEAIKPGISYSHADMDIHGALVAKANLWAGTKAGTAAWSLMGSEAFDLKLPTSWLQAG